MTVLDADLNIKSTWSPSQDTSSILRTFVYSRASCSFVPSQSAPPRGAIVVSLVISGDSICVRTLSIDDADNILELGNCLVSLKSDVRHVFSLSFNQR